MVTFVTTLNCFIDKPQNLVANWLTEFYLVFLLVATGATDASDVTDSPFIPPESRPPVLNPHGEQGIYRHSTKSAEGLPSLCTLHLIWKI